jgi:hypothetical protein
LREQTGLPYTSCATGVDPDGNIVDVVHACAYDMHVTCLSGAATLLARNRDRWARTHGAFSKKERDRLLGIANLGVVFNLYGQGDAATLST